MDRQDSGASPFKLLTDEELGQALAGLSTEAAMQLLEEQAELRRKQAELDAVVKQRDALLAVEEESQIAPVAQAQPVSVQPLDVEPAPEQHAEPDVTFEQVFSGSHPVFDLPTVPSLLPEPTQPQTPAQVSEPEDIAASLNALYGAGSVSGSAEEVATEIEEHEAQAKPESLVDELILQFGGEEDEDAASAKTQKIKVKAAGRSAWSLITTWNGSGALIVALLIGFSFAGSGRSLGSLLLGGFVAFVVLGLAFAFSALAARRGNALQQVLARAAFGVTGNIIPAVVLLVARILGVAVALMSASLAVNILYPQLAFTRSISFNLAAVKIDLPSMVIVAAAMLAVITALSWIRGRALEISRTLVTIVTLCLTVAIVVIAELQQKVAYRANLGFDLFEALGLASSIVVVFGLLYATTAADENRRIRSTTIVPKFLAAGILNWLISGSLALVAGFALASLDLNQTLLLPIAIVVSVLGLLSLATMIAQTSNQLVGLRAPEPRALTRLLLAVIILAVAVWLYMTFDASTIWQSLMQVLPLAGVPVAAWLGIFTADVMLRRTDYHLVSLDKNYGFYRGWNLMNLLGWIAATAVGLGLIKSDVSWLAWNGYLADLLALEPQLLFANLGIWVALGLGFLIPVITGIPRIRRQERETLAIEARRQALIEVIGEPEL